MDQKLTINWPQGLSQQQFLNDYWQKKSLLIRNAFPEFDNPLSPDELGGLALEDDINSRLILRQAPVENDAASTTQWHMQSGPFSEDELTSLPAKDWSLLVSDIDKHLDGFHQYLQPFRFIPDWQIDDLMISYAPTGASVGAHIDEYDVFLLQAAGRREWRIDSRQEVDTRFIPGLDIKVLQHFDANEQWVLEPGDMLYLPPGVPHHGISLDDDCMTWSIGFRAIAYADLVTQIAHQIAARQSDSLRYRETTGLSQSHPGEVSNASLQALYTIWKKLTEVEFDEFTEMAGNVLTQRNPSFAAEETRQHETLDNIVSHTTLSRDAASRLAFVKTADNITLHADEHAYQISEPLAIRLCDDYLYPVSEIKTLIQNSDDNTECIVKLWQRGILLPED